MGLKLSTSNSKRQLSMSVSQPVSAVNLSAQSPNAAEGNIKADKKSGKETELPPVYSPNSTYVVGNMIIDKKTGRAIEAPPGYNPNSLVVGNVIINKETKEIIAPKPGPLDLQHDVSKIIPKGYTRAPFNGLDVHVFVTNTKKHEVSVSLGNKEHVAEEFTSMVDSDTLVMINGSLFGGKPHEKYYSETYGPFAINGHIYEPPGDYKINYDYPVFVYKNDENNNEIAYVGFLDEYTFKNEIAPSAKFVIGGTHTLLVNGQKQVEGHDKAVNPKGVAPRTMLGIREDGSLILVVVDGKNLNGEVFITTEGNKVSGRSGISLYEGAEIMKNLGCIHAINLDGGGSSRMYYNGRVVSKPTDPGRPIGSTVIVKIKETEE